MNNAGKYTNPAVGLCLLAAAGHLWGEPGSSIDDEAPGSGSRIVMDDTGTLAIPAHSVPLSSYLSERSKQAFLTRKRDLDRAVAGMPADGPQLSMDKVFYAPRVDAAKARYPVDIGEATLAGVRVDIVTPAEGVAESNRQRVLVNLHGGGFFLGEGLGGLLESIPIASVGGFKVVSVHYRQAPDHVFPAASEDVARVYRELLKRYDAGSIGMFGCSAGGMLTAMSTAWFQDEGLPRPGAIGLFCGAADTVVGGDARYFGNALEGTMPPPPSPNPAPTGMPYLPGGEAELYEPLVSPVFSPRVLAEFPPTLLISGTRDGALSSVLYTHTQLVKAGVEADLHVWEGMWHCFFNDVDLPEAEEAYDVIGRFFARHLDGAP